MLPCPCTGGHHLTVTEPLPAIARTSVGAPGVAAAASAGVAAGQPLGLEPAPAAPPEGAPLAAAVSAGAPTNRAQTTNSTIRIDGPTARCWLIVLALLNTADLAPFAPLAPLRVPLIADDKPWSVPLPF